MTRMNFWIRTFLLLALSVSAFGQEKTSAPPVDDPAIRNSPAIAEEPKLDLTPDANGRLSQLQMQALLRVAADKDMENDKLLREYTYTEREIQNKLDGKGQTKSTEVKTYEILEVYGEQVQRLIEKDDKPLPEKEADKEEEKIQKIIDKRKNESDDERRKREEKEEKDREQDREFVRDAADAYNFTLVGSEVMSGGREAWVIAGEPREGFVPHTKNGKYLSKFHGRIWIDKTDFQVAKVDVECLDTISWGLFLARFHKGSRFMLEQTRVNDEVWLPMHVTFKLDARVALLKGYNMEGEQIYHDYKKFRTSARIVGTAEAK